MRKLALLAVLVHMVWAGASGGRTARARLRRPTCRLGEEPRLFGLHPRTAVTALAGQRSLGLLAAGTLDGRLVVWDAVHGTTRSTVRLGSTVWDLLFLPADPDATLLAATNDGLVALEMRSTHQRQVRIPLGGAMSLAAVAQKGRVLVAVGAKDRAIHLLAWRAGRFQPLGRLVGHMSWVGNLAFLDGGGRLASGSWDESVRLWDVSSRRQLWRKQFFRFAVSGLVVADETVVAASDDGRIAAFRLRHGRVSVVRKIAKFFGLESCCGVVWGITWSGQVFGLTLPGLRPFLRRRIVSGRRRSLRSLAAWPGWLAMGDSEGRVYLYRLVGCR